jgi:AraC family transcriptional regulator, regulatory protein of adaptative response / DNA-3-methyladenine glycosylase II
MTRSAYFYCASSCLGVFVAEKVFFQRPLRASACYAMSTTRAQFDYSEIDLCALDVCGPLSSIWKQCNRGPKTSSLADSFELYWGYNGNAFEWRSKHRRRDLIRRVAKITMLDWQVCTRARLSRDARFDGKFFIGVRSTRIYCRPICPVPTVKEENVRYFPTAAAASEAGFRPCLRCRPECSPGTPAWFGASSTVSRALRLICESGLEDGGMECLAERLGVSSRHLRRLFIQHLGASPSAVAKTRRLHFAKKLIDETTLSMTDIALSSGFGCVRRFNAVIRKTYNRTPTQIRQLARRKTSQQQDHYLFDLRFRPPYHWQGMLTFLAERAIPGVETVDSKAYRRTISLNGCHGYFEVSPDEERDAVAVRVRIADPRSLYLIIERIRRMFDLNADWAVIRQSLGTDPALASLIRAEPGQRVPGCWSGFELTILAILGQQSSLKVATKLAGRIAERYGQRISDADDLTHLFPTPETLAHAKLAGLGLTEKQAGTIQALARAVCDGAIRFERIGDSDAFLEQFLSIPGVSCWTAQYVAMRALGEPDAFPIDDAALLRALGLKSSCELERRAEAWRPWRSYATMYLWSAVKGSTTT